MILWSRHSFSSSVLWKKNSSLSSFCVSQGQQDALNCRKVALLGVRGPQSLKSPPQICFLALNSAVNHQGNLGKHIRVEKQHIGIISLRIVFMELQEHCSCSRGGNEIILVYKVLLESVSILT